MKTGTWSRKVKSNAAHRVSDYGHLSRQGMSGTAAKNVRFGLNDSGEMKA